MDTIAQVICQMIPHTRKVDKNAAILSTASASLAWPSPTHVTIMTKDRPWERFGIKDRRHVFRDGNSQHVVRRPRQQQPSPRPPSTMSAKLTMYVRVTNVTALIRIMRSGTCLLRGSASTTTATATAAMATSGTATKASSLVTWRMPQMQQAGATTPGTSPPVVPPYQQHHPPLQLPLPLQLQLLFQQQLQLQLQ